jgi:hypothetical protein
MIESLTKEQEQLMYEVRDEYLDRFFTFRDIDPKACEDAVEFVYSLGGFAKPEVIIVDSPKAAQEKANELCGTKNKWYDFSTYLSYFDLVWLSFYDFFHRIGVKYECKEFYTYLEKVRDARIYDSIQFETVCIVSRLPITISREDERLHAEEGPAIAFKDGYKLYFWKGVAVPEKLIETPNKITKEDILAQDNAEVRRAFMEKLGGKKYYDVLTDGKGLRKVHTDTDKQGNIMVLWETKEEDKIARKKVQFLECQCPSTGRVYNIYPPNQQSKDVWEAKRSTFSGEKLYYRHGDVGLVKVGETTEHPVKET